MSLVGLFGSAWQGSLSDLADMIQHIKRIRAFGRLTLRNTERFSIVHLYFRAGRPVHLASNRGGADIIFAELQEWKSAFLRFDRGITTLDVTFNVKHEQLLEDTIKHLQMQGLVQTPPIPRVIDSSLIVAHDAKQLLTPREWQILVEGTRRVSLAVAHLIGPKEALNVLQDVLDDCSADFPAFASLKIAPSGYLQVTDRSYLDHLYREELLEGFTALISICQYFCSPIIGDREAHRLIVQALHDVGPALTSLGVFRIDHELLSSRGP